VNVADVIAVIQAEFLPDQAIAADTPLLSSGAIDSLNFSALVALLENRFGVRIELMDIGYDNFDTPSQMCQLIDDGRAAL
jgi:acyl carrier protein